MAAAPILSWEGLSLQQGNGWLFRDLDIHIGPRDRLALIGRNGAGKTTLLKLLAGSIDADKGKRHALPGARIMVHQPWGGAQGTASDIHIQAQEILRLKEYLNGILAKHTGKPVKEIAKDTDRDFFMSAEEAVRYGLVDDVLGAAPAKA